MCRREDKAVIHLVLQYKHPWRPQAEELTLFYGVPKAQRRLLFYLLSPVLRILFITSSRVEEALNERLD
jgi:hypothetical protein